MHLESYQIAVVVGVAVVLLVILYLLLKKRSKKEVSPEDIEQQVEEDKQESQPEEIKKDTIDRATDDRTTEEPKERATEQEKVEEVVIEEEKEEALQSSTPDFKTRPVPTHGKIKKEDFTQFSGMRVLLAEDNIINQKVMLGLLKDSGMDIVVANDGQEALDILEKDSNFVLVLMDAHMPNVDGFEATKIIRKNPKYNHIAVIALSGDTASDDIKKMKDAGMSDTLEKPLKMDAFYDILYAYNIEKPKTETPTAEISEKKFLNTEAGLAICGGDSDLYKELLKEFLENYINSAASLEQLIQKNRLEEADKLLLDIMGISANLGAERLHDIASKSKSILKSQEANLSEALKTYTNNLKESILLINRYIQDN